MAAYALDGEDTRGAQNPDFLALGLGGTNMMSMLWAVAMGRRAVGIEMRGDPFLGVHWNIRADFYHQLGVLDRLMIERYGEDRIPRRGDSNKLFRLADTFYSIETRSGDIVADEIIDGFDLEQHIAGTIHDIEFIDDRWSDGVPSRTVSVLDPPEVPDRPDDALIRTNIAAVLDGPSVFQAGAASVQVMFRRYLEKMEQMDLDGGFEPRVRLFTRHRVVTTPDGMVRQADGRIAFRVEALQELDYRGKFVRVRRPGSDLIEIGVPELFMIAQGFHSTDAERLGFKQEDVAFDHKDGRGPVIAQADFLAGLVEVLVGGRLRRRISSVFDDRGDEYWVRQIAVGHEADPEVGWVLVQVPDFKTFDPIQEGIVPEGTDPDSPEYFAAYETLLYDFYCQQVGDILEMPESEVRKLEMVYGPKLFSLIERMGADALLAPNGVVAGDSFGNGHFLPSGGAMTGMVGHSWRVYQYYQARDAGVPHAQAIRTLADKIKEDTLGWLEVSAKEYSEAVPINFGAERIAQIEAAGGIPSSARAAAIDATRRQRHSLIALDPSDWRRLFLRNGRVYSAPLPELSPVHPALRRQQPGKHGGSVAVVSPDHQPSSLSFIEGALGQPGVKLGLVTAGSIDDLPETIRERLAAFASIPDIGNTDQIAAAVAQMRETLGQLERLLGTAPELQVPLAEVREKLRIEGMHGAAARIFCDANRMRQYLTDAGLPTARGAQIESMEEGHAFGAEVGWHPILVKRDLGAGAGSSYRADTEGELNALLQRLRPTPEHPLICEEFVEGQECTFEVFSAGGVPAWFSATRFSPRPFENARNRRTALRITLPREQDDPADLLVRRMGFAAIRALRMDTGISSMRWIRRPDGTPIIMGVIAGPPPAPIISLMTISHGVDMYRVWGKAAVDDLFTPDPRIYAAGAAVFGAHGEGTTVSAVHGLREVEHELGDMIVEMQAPRVGDPWSNSLVRDGFMLLRHTDTSAVDEALQLISDAVWVELGDGSPKEAS